MQCDAIDYITKIKTILKCNVFRPDGDLVCGDHSDFEQKKAPGVWVEMLAFNQFREWLRESLRELGFRVT